MSPIARSQKTLCCGLYNKHVNTYIFPYLTSAIECRLGSVVMVPLDSCIIAVYNNDCASSYRFAPLIIVWRLKNSLLSATQAAQTITIKVRWPNVFPRRYLNPRAFKATSVQVNESAGDKPYPPRAAKGAKRSGMSSGTFIPSGWR